jgi:hypothetical protein
MPANKQIIAGMARSYGMEKAVRKETRTAFLLCRFYFN